MKLSGKVSKPISIANPHFVIQKTTDGVPRYQVLRELTQNAIEAGATQARWTVDTHFEKEYGSDNKLSIEDNGKGMTGSELPKFIGEYANSGKNQRMDENFGVGAKLAGLSFSPAGIVYRSWTNRGPGSMCILAYDGSQIGLRAIGPAGETVVEVPFSQASDLIKKAGHGTVVTLLGSSPKDSTFGNVGGKNGKGGSHWVGRVLARRYFKLPEGFSLKYVDSAPDSSRPHSVIPQGDYLKSSSSDSGTLVLSGGYLVHWSILKDKPTSGEREVSNPNLAQFGVIYQDEVYRIETGSSAIPKLHRFGIVLGADRVAIYVEATKESGARANFERTRVELPGAQDLPLAQIQDAFIEAMPEALVEYVKSKSNNAILDMDAMAKELSPIMEKMGVGRFVRNPRGDLFVAANDIVLGAAVKINTDESPATGNTVSSPSSSSHNPTELSEALDETRKGESASRKPVRVPKVILCSDIQAGKVVLDIDVQALSSAGDEINDRAAVYVEGAENTLYINLDFRGYLKLEQSARAEVGKSSKHTSMLPKEAVNALLLKIYIMGIVESIVSTALLVKNWSPEERRGALSAEALTTAAMSRGLVLQQTLRELGELN